MPNQETVNQVTPDNISNLFISVFGVVTFQNMRKEKFTGHAIKINYNWDEDAVTVFLQFKIISFKWHFFII